MSLAAYILPHLQNDRCLQSAKTVAAGAFVFMVTNLALSILQISTLGLLAGCGIAYFFWEVWQVTNNLQELNDKKQDLNRDAAFKNAPLIFKLFEVYNASP